MVQTAIQNRSTDPKKIGARINTTMVVQSWIELNIAKTPTYAGGIIAMGSWLSA
jgi:hypothetical protein